MVVRLPENKQVILFDGVCNLCNSSVTFIIKRDKKDVFRFASLQSDFGQKFVDPSQKNSYDSIILIDSEKNQLKKSSAALNIARHLSGYSWMRVFLYIPRPVRDYIYSIIAKNRYRWFGKREECMIPTPELKSKFIDE